MKLIEEHLRFPTKKFDGLEKSKLLDQADLFKFCTQFNMYNEKEFNY